MNTKALTMAEQQIVGFTAAKTGEDIVAMAESMGMTGEEWAVIQSNDGLHMRAKDVDALNDYYA